MKINYLLPIAALALLCLMTTTTISANPVISDVQVSSIDDTSAVVTWTTDTSSDSRVTYGTSTPPSTNVDDSTLTTNHSVLVSGLTACTTYYFSVTSTDTGGSTTDNNGGSYYNFSTKYREYLLPFDDVESGTQEWTVDTTSGSSWHIDGCRYFSASNSWKAGGDDYPTCTATYDGNTETRLVSKSLDLGAVGNQYKLNWKEWFDIEIGFDWGVVEISTDGGINWDELGSEFDGSDGWQSNSLDLTGYSGSVNLGFSLYSDDTNNYEGWYVDDIDVSRVVECSTDIELDYTVIEDDTCSGTGSGGDGYIDAGESAVLSVSLKNIGHGTATNVTGTLSTSTTGVTITDNSADFPDIPTNETKTSISPHFSFSISRNVSCGTVIEFTLHVHSDQGDWYPTFTQTVGHYNPTIDESFGSGDPPTGWTVVDGGTGSQKWTTGNPGSHTPPAGITSPFEIIDSDYDGENYTQDDSLITPAIDCSSASVVTLDFDTWFYVSDAPANSATIDVSTDGGSTWNPNHVIEWSDQDVGSDTTASHQHFDISSWAAGHSSVKIRFYYNAEWSYWWMIDNVVVTLVSEGTCNMTPCCQNPSGLTNNSAEDSGTCPNTSVTVTWNQDPSNWGDTGSGTRTYDVLRDGSPIQTGIAYGTTSYIDTTVEKGTHYDYSVKYNNDCGLSSETAGAGITTQVCTTPPVPDGTNGTTPLESSWNIGKTTIHVTYDTTSCSSNAYNLLYGSFSNLSTYTWDGSECDITSGSYDWTPPSGDIFWIIVGDNNGKESSWGKKYTGGTYSQRSATPSGQCGTTTIDTTSTCP